LLLTGVYTCNRWVTSEMRIYHQWTRLPTSWRLGFLFADNAPGTGADGVRVIHGFYGQPCGECQRQRC
jgi:hypothetical protein